MHVHGVIPAIGTPLGQNDRVDVPALRKLNQYLLSAGVNGVFANGSMGGFAFLTDDEQIRSIETTVSEASGSVPVFGGLGATSTSRALPLLRRIAATGVDFICALPPFFFLASQQQLINYFTGIAAATDKPLVLYDNPILTKNPIHVDTIASLFEQIPHLAGIKVSDPDQVKLQAITRMAENKPGFFVLTGNELLLVSGLQMGCDGFVGGLYNVCPHLAVNLYQAFRRGDLKEAVQLQNDIAAVWEIFRYGSVWGGFDEALRYLAICQRATGMPYVTDLSEAERESVHNILRLYVQPYLESAVVEQEGVPT
ncbi:MAG: dihydrodipicolinate synthase family protein [Acidobacteriaceae bacterium]|nr:dihydrodipicolinate synthase family protein [Acidobacteriaceae bacterium]